MTVTLMTPIGRAPSCPQHPDGHRPAICGTCHAWHHVICGRTEAAARPRSGGFPLGNVGQR